MKEPRRLDLADLPKDAPEWAKTLLEAFNENAAALLETQSEMRNRAPVEHKLAFTTKTPASDSFVPPIRVTLGFTPSRVAIVRVENRTTPSLVSVLSPHIDWVKVAGGMLVRSITGLDDATSYTVTLECTP